MLKIAIIGLGDVSHVHLAAIKENPTVSLVAACDIDETLRSSVTGSSFYTDYEEMLVEEALDCVHICLPHHLHYEVTKACVEKGIHVFLEKPIAHNMEEGRALVKLEEANPDTKICISYQNRMNVTFEKLQELVGSGQYGKVTGVKGIVTWFRPKSYYDLKPWRGTMAQAGGGVMINQAIHTLDLMQLIGGEVETIKGSIDNFFDYGVEVEDTAAATIRFRNGATGLFFATITNAADSSVEFQVFCEKGEFTIKDSLLTVVNDLGEKIELTQDEQLKGRKFYYGASHSRLINHFYNCIKNDTSDYIHAKEALISLELVTAIRQSSEKNEAITLIGNLAHNA